MKTGNPQGNIKSKLLQITLLNISLLNLFKSICLILLLGLSSSLQAQTEETAHKTSHPRWGINFQMNDLVFLSSFFYLRISNSDNQFFSLRYKLTEKWTIRNGIGIQFKHNKIKQITPNLQEGGLTNTRENQYGFTSYTLSPRLEYHFSTKAKFDPYLGFEIPLNLNTNLSTNIVRSRSLEENGVIRQEVFTRSFNQPNSQSFQARALMGFNYFIKNNMAIGAHYGFGYKLDRTNGERVQIDTFTETQDGIEVNFTSETRLRQVETRSNSFIFDGGIHINILIYLGNWNQ